MTAHSASDIGFVQMADLHMLSRAERVALRKILDLPPDAPLGAVLDAVKARNMSLNRLLWALELELEDPVPGFSRSANPPTNLTSTHPLCDIYNADELRILARKLDIPIAYRTANELAADIDNVAKHNGWNADTLNLMLHTRKMPRFSQAKDILG